MGSDQKNNDQHEGHHILSDDSSRNVLLLLLVLTIITVAIAQFDFGKLNFPIAMAVATVKAMMVVRIFMGMRWDRADNKLFFSSGVIFFFVFVILTATDLFSRGSYRVTGSEFIETQTAGGPVFNEPWKSSPEILEHAKGLYKGNCASCHGDDGLGNGIAAAALNPKPRNFADPNGWKNGRKVTQVFATLTNGLGLMPQFNNLSATDRWALSHYVDSFAPTPAEAPTPEEYLAQGLDVSKPDGGLGGEVKKTIPIDFAFERYLEAQGADSK